jgi:hypothetical protein
VIEDEAVVLQRLREAHAALMQAHSAAFRAGYGDQFMAAVEDAVRAVEHVRKMLA